MECSKCLVHLNHFIDTETETERGKVGVTMRPSFPRIVPFYACGPSIILFFFFNLFIGV